MKRYKKKELQKMVSELISVNDTIGKAVKDKTSDVVDILAACQESAIRIGTCLEALDGKYVYLVRLLEEYCENVFQLSEAGTDERQCRRLSKKIRKQLNQLLNGITYELPNDRKEVVFLPYKASMWDSLESIWRAAAADREIDAFVVPIPYFDKNPDGTFREEHYEGDQYPEYVPITDYREYDLEERKPDEIYIHNPYDNYNLVTSVHPYFYSENLKKFTDKLVYIPYFILPEVEPENARAVEGIKHFITVQGVYNADKVIVQSEKMRQAYIKVLTEEMGGTKETRKYWENRIDASGSPKLEKLANTAKGDVEIPEEWLRIINRPDGAPKKIVFYNSSIAAMLAHKGAMLRKMQAVFQIFKENKDKIALLWRPHPLMESTLICICPQLWEAYKTVRDQYIGEGWGIYDDTADIDRAIVISDAYYGDQSSVAELYRQTGKPIMLQQLDT